MKKALYCTAFLYFLLATPLFAQKVRYEKKDKKIYVDEKPFGIIERIKQNPVKGDDYSVKTLTNKEIIVFKFDEDKNFYQVIFMETGEKGYLLEYTMSFKEIAKNVVANKFIENDALNEDAKKRFLILNGKEPEPRPSLLGGIRVDTKLSGNNNNNSASPATQPYQLVERDKSADFFVMNGEIKQDFKVVGKYQEKDRMGGGKMYQVFIITLPDGTQVAEAVGEGVAPNVYEVFTFADRRKSNVTVKFNTDPLTDIARYLTDGRYL